LLIPTDQITDWQDLQNKVAQLFAEMGYRTTTPKVVDLAGRGRKEVDVYIEDPRASVNQIILIECKLWNTPVSQDTVHSMHTVMSGSGANTGFIVSKAGFQSGAHEAAAKTNRRPIERFGDIVAHAILGGLHHRYTRI
jgi:predicted Mrr-cat superfamily restriction endonuclease